MNNTKILNASIEQFKDAFARLDDMDKNTVSKNLYKVLRSRVRDEKMNSISTPNWYSQAS